MFSSPSTCSQACPLPCRCTLALCLSASALLSLEHPSWRTRSTPPASHLSIPSHILETNTFWLAVSGYFWAELLLPLFFPLVFLVFTKAISPTIQSCSLSSLSLSLISRRAIMPSMGRAEPVWCPPLLPGFSLPLVSGTCCVTPLMPVSPTMLFKGEQDSARLTLPARDRLRLPSATPPHSQNREVTPPQWTCSPLPRI